MTSAGTASGFSRPPTETTRSVGTKPWISAPMAIPAMTYGRTRRTMSWVERQASRTRVLEGRLGLDDRARRVDLPDVVLDVALEVQPADDEARDDGDRQARRHVRDRDARAKEAPQQDDRDLVDHRRGDEEGERHAERDADLHEADEQAGRPSRSRTA